MADIINPTVIDEGGNILLHGREGATIAVAFRDADDEPLDLTTRILFFEIKGFLRKALEPGSTERHLLLTREDLAPLSMSSRGTPFAFLDETGQTPDVLWEGSLILRGYKAAPEA